MFELLHLPGSSIGLDSEVLNIPVWMLVCHTMKNDKQHTSTSAAALSRGPSPKVCPPHLPKKGGCPSHVGS